MVLTADPVLVIKNDEEMMIMSTDTDGADSPT